MNIQEYLKQYIKERDDLKKNSNLKGSEIKEIEDNIKKLSEEEYKKKREISNYYSDLTNKEYNKINELKDSIDTNYKNAVFLPQQKRYLYFTEVALSNKSSITVDYISFLDFKRLENDRRYGKFLKPLFDEDNLKVGLYIYENDKPKNKYTLCCIGQTIFNHSSDIINIPYMYGLRYDTFYSKANIKNIIKDFPTLEDIETWLNKNFVKILKEFYETFKEFETEYFEFLELVKNENLEVIKEKLEDK
ncbi:MAG: hypothetical protein GY830_07765 [Bacteroidetes bacterium]|nr:hypothetical protein [Bacteroidota bacterium]